MLDELDLQNIDSKGLPLTIRSVFIIDPNKKIRLIMAYPASTGRNTAEVLRVIDSLQTGDKRGVTTPVNWLVRLIIPLLRNFLISAALLWNICVPPY